MHLACWLLLLAADGTDSSNVEKQQKPLYEINREISRLLQRDSSAKVDRERAAAAYEMALLYREILADPRLPTSPSLKESRGRLWSRLTRIKKDVLAKIRRESKDGADDLSDEITVTNMSLSTMSMADSFSLVGAT